MATIALQFFLDLSFFLAFSLASDKSYRNPSFFIAASRFLTDFMALFMSSFLVKGLFSSSDSALPSLSNSSLQHRKVQKL